MREQLQSIYPVSLGLLADSIPEVSPDQLPDYLVDNPQICGIHPYLPDLARIEYAVHLVKNHKKNSAEPIVQRIVHPGLDLLELSWQGLADLYYGRKAQPVAGKTYLIVVPEGDKSEVKVREATNYDLLALKIVAEDIAPETAARQAGITIGFLDNILYVAAQKGFLLVPPSKIVRPDGFCDDVEKDSRCSSPSFTLQWHITQACNLHCRHCYDRSSRETMTMDQGLHVLDDFYQFCQEHNVYGQVTFTGGNPLHYSEFLNLYQETVDRGFLTGILGNPMEISSIKEMAAIQKPEFYQVSLEGLQEHNDYIRGAGHYEQVLDFLPHLKELNIYSMVMLTLTSANVDQVIPLANILEDKTDLFTYNRLALTGEGAALTTVEPEKYKNFVKEYIETAKTNRIVRLKDNLCNLQLFQDGEPLGGGCAGVGCGAAFNFVSLLPDGEVHACRKLPSLLGNIYKDSLTDIYQSSLAEKYRMGSAACSGCEIRPSCGGCPAVSKGFGLDVFTDLDPYCFKPD